MAFLLADTLVQKGQATLATAFLQQVKTSEVGFWAETCRLVDVLPFTKIRTLLHFFSLFCCDVEGGDIQITSHDLLDRKYVTLHVGKDQHYSFFIESTHFAEEDLAHEQVGRWLLHFIPQMLPGHVRFLHTYKLSRDSFFVRLLACLRGSGSRDALLREVPQALQRSTIPIQLFIQACVGHLFIQLGEAAPVWEEMDAERWVKTLLACRHTQLFQLGCELLLQQHITCIPPYVLSIASRDICWGCRFCKMLSWEQVQPILDQFPQKSLLLNELFASPVPSWYKELIVHESERATNLEMSVYLAHCPNKTELLSELLRVHRKKWVPFVIHHPQSIQVCREGIARKEPWALGLLEAITEVHHDREIVSFWATLFRQGSVRSNGHQPPYSRVLALALRHADKADDDIITCMQHTTDEGAALDLLGMRRVLLFLCGTHCALGTIQRISHICKDWCDETIGTQLVQRFYALSQDSQELAWYFSLVDAKVMPAVLPSLQVELFHRGMMHHKIEFTKVREQHVRALKQKLTKDECACLCGQVSGKLANYFAPDPLTRSTKAKASMPICELAKRLLRGEQVATVDSVVSRLLEIDDPEKQLGALVERFSENIPPSLWQQLLNHSEITLDTDTYIRCLKVAFRKETLRSQLIPYLVQHPLCFAYPESLCMLRELSQVKTVVPAQEAAALVGYFLKLLEAHPQQRKEFLRLMYQWYLEFHEAFASRPDVGLRLLRLTSGSENPEMFKLDCEVVAVLTPHLGKLVQQTDGFTRLKEFFGTSKKYPKSSESFLIKKIPEFAELKSLHLNYLLVGTLFDFPRFFLREALVDVLIQSLKMTTSQDTTHASHETLPLKESWQLLVELLDKGSLETRAAIYKAFLLQEGNIPSTSNFKLNQKVGMTFTTGSMKLYEKLGERYEAFLKDCLKSKHPAHTLLGLEIDISLSNNPNPALIHAVRHLSDHKALLCELMVDQIEHFNWWIQTIEIFKNMVYFFTAPHAVSEEHNPTRYPLQELKQELYVLYRHETMNAKYYQESQRITSQSIPEQEVYPVVTTVSSVKTLHEAMLPSEGEYLSMLDCLLISSLQRVRRGSSKKAVLLDFIAQTLRNTIEQYPKVIWLQRHIQSYVTCIGEGDPLFTVHCSIARALVSMATTKGVVSESEAGKGGHTLSWHTWLRSRTEDVGVESTQMLDRILRDLHSFNYAAENGTKAENLTAILKDMFAWQEAFGYLFPEMRGKMFRCFFGVWKQSGVMSLEMRSYIEMLFVPNYIAFGCDRGDHERELAVQLFDEYAGHLLHAGHAAILVDCLQKVVSGGLFKRRFPAFDALIRKMSPAVLADPEACRIFTHIVTGVTDDIDADAQRRELIYFWLSFVAKAGNEGAQKAACQVFLESGCLIEYSLDRGRIEQLVQIISSLVDQSRESLHSLITQQLATLYVKLTQDDREWFMKILPKSLMSCISRQEATF